MNIIDGSSGASCRSLPCGLTAVIHAVSAVFVALGDAQLIFPQGPRELCFRNRQGVSFRGKQRFLISAATRRANLVSFIGNLAKAFRETSIYSFERA
jgi:hypothetical protein